MKYWTALLLLYTGCSSTSNIHSASKFELEDEFENKLDLSIESEPDMEVDSHRDDVVCNSTKDNFLGNSLVEGETFILHHDNETNLSNSTQCYELKSKNLLFESMDEYFVSSRYKSNPDRFRQYHSYDLNIKNAATQSGKNFDLNRVWVGLYMAPFEGNGKLHLIECTDVENGSTVRKVYTFNEHHTTCAKNGSLTIQIPLDRDKENEFLKEIIHDKAALSPDERRACDMTKESCPLNNSWRGLLILFDGENYKYESIQGNIEAPVTMGQINEKLNISITQEDGISKEINVEYQILRVKLSDHK